MQFEQELTVYCFHTYKPKIKKMFCISKSTNTATDRVLHYVLYIFYEIAKAVNLT